MTQYVASWPWVEVTQNILTLQLVTLPYTMAHNNKTQCVPVIYWNKSVAMQIHHSNPRTSNRGLATGSYKPYSQLCVVYLYTLSNTSICMHTQLTIGIFIHLYSYMYTNAYIYTCIHTNTYTDTNTHIHIHTHMHTHTYTYTHTRTHTNTHIHVYTHKHTHIITTCTHKLHKHMYICMRTTNDKSLTN